MAKRKIKNYFEVKLQDGVWGDLEHPDFRIQVDCPAANWTNVFYIDRGYTENFELELFYMHDGLKVVAERMNNMSAPNGFSTYKEYFEDKLYEMRNSKTTIVLPTEINGNTLIKFRVAVAYNLIIKHMNQYRKVVYPELLKRIEAGEELDFKAELEPVFTRMCKALQKELDKNMNAVLDLLRLNLITF